MAGRWAVVLGMLAGLAGAIGSPVGRADEFLSEARRALRRASDFYSQRVASHGGYVYRYSADLTLREGEGKTGDSTVWVQPPGTPTVGLAFVDAYELTGEPYLLEAARAAGICLVRGQLRSGGWNQSIEFDPAVRKKFAYRVDPAGKRQFDVTTFDDDKTQSAVRFLTRLDAALQFQDATIHEATRFALDSILKAQRPNGGWPQGYREFPKAADFPPHAAQFPETWSRTYPGGDYWDHYTFNDNAVADTIDALFLASKVYDEPRYRAAAVKAGEFILSAQLPEPQPAWAQQYDSQMRPAWARKFEPPAVTGGESQRLLRALLRLYVETGERRFLEPIPRALAYLKKSRLPDGRLARFYELQTNRPLYLTRDYQLTYDDDDLPTHYGFQVGSDLEAIERDYRRLLDASPADVENLRAPVRAMRPVRSDRLEQEARRLVRALDERGAWVETGRLRYHPPKSEDRPIVDSQTFAKNLVRLSGYVGAGAP